MDEERKSATFASHAKSNVSEDEDEDKDGSCVSIRDVIISEKQEAVLKGLSIYIARPLQPDDKEDEYQSPRALTPAVEDSNLLTSGDFFPSQDAPELSGTPSCNISPPCTENGKLVQTNELDDQASPDMGELHTQKTIESEMEIEQSYCDSVKVTQELEDDTEPSGQDKIELDNKHEGMDVAVSNIEQNTKREGFEINTEEANEEGQEQDELAEQDEEDKEEKGDEEACRQTNQASLHYELFGIVSNKGEPLQIEIRDKLEKLCWEYWRG
eukprot:m.301101 g.301101  ORF g.301101 m.301101 type:complete len:270 (-) comp16425_c0_seq36:3075-3884(-)